MIFRKDKINMKAIFEKLNRINNSYKNTIGDLGTQFLTESERDSRYSDELIAERVRERTDRFNAEIEKAAEKAREAAAPTISELRERLREYVAFSGDPSTLATLQSLIVGGVELSEGEVEAFAANASYPAQLLLEKVSGGRFKAKRLEDFEKDLAELAVHFRNLRSYRGGMTSITTETFWGSSATVGSFIEQKQIDGFAAKLDEISSRWDMIVKEGESA